VSTAAIHIAISTPISASIFTPTDTSARTSGWPSGCITTIDQVPPSTSHCRVCTPLPLAVAAQNVWSVGAGATDAPSTLR
jgi:hypothetical protein